MPKDELDEDKIRQWVKENKQELVDRFFAAQTIKQAGDKRTIFMAGIPGAGKTEFVRRMAKQPGFDYIVIEHDKLVELIDGYKAEHYYAYRQAGNTLVTEILKRCLRQCLSFIFDTTLAKGRSTSNVKQAIARGYKVEVIYVVQEPGLAWQFTQDRERDQKRNISPKGFAETCQLINPNLAEIYGQHKNSPQFTFSCFDKRQQQPSILGKLTTSQTPAGRRVIAKILAQEYNWESGNQKQS